MYCTKCGKKNADDRLFCGFCGSPLDTNEPEAKEDVERRLSRPPAGGGQGNARAGREPPAAERSPGAALRSPEQAPMKPPRPPRQDDRGGRRIAEEEWPAADIEPPIPPRPQFKDASAADEEETKAPFEEESDEEDPCPSAAEQAGGVARQASAAAFAPPRRSSPARPRARARQHRGAAARARSDDLFLRMRPTPRTTSPTSCKNIWMITAMRIGRGVFLRAPHPRLRLSDPAGHLLRWGSTSG